MALSVDYLYQFSLKLIRKNQAGGLDSIEWQYHWNDAQASYLDDLIGRFQARNNGKTGMNTGLIENETILTKLTPFTKPDTIVVSGGHATKPADFIYTLALRVGNDYINKITQNQKYAVLNSVIDPPSIPNKTYYYLEYLDYYSILPSSVTSIDLDYIAEVTNVVWGFTLDGAGRKIYDSTTSVQSLWDDHSNREITKRMLTNIGIAYKDQQFENFGKTVQLTGE